MHIFTSLIKTRDPHAFNKENRKNTIIVNKNIQIKKNKTGEINTSSYARNHLLTYKVSQNPKFGEGPG